MPRENRPTRRGGMRGDLSEVRKKGTSPSSSDSKKPSLWDSVKNWFKPKTQNNTPRQNSTLSTLSTPSTPKHGQIIRNSNTVYNNAVRNNSIKKLRNSVTTWFNDNFQFNFDKRSNVNYRSEYLYTSQNFVNETYVVKAFKDAKESDVGAQGRLRAKMDNSPNLTRSLQSYALDPLVHGAYITAGQTWMEDMVPKSKADKYILNVDENGEATLNMDEIVKDFGNDYAAVNAFFKSEEEQQQALIDYYDKNTISKQVFNFETGEYETVERLKADAEMPFWVKDTKENRNIWTYYINYMDETFNTQYEAAETARKEREKALKYGYKSSWSDEESSEIPKSFIEALFADIGDELNGEYERFNIKSSNLYKWGRDYVVNPLRAGKFGTFAGNRIYGLFSLGDAVSRPIRALKAGETEIGGHTKFKGQNAYWATLEGYSDDAVREAQIAFMQNGGVELLNRKHSGYGDIKDLQANSKFMMYSDKELEEYITEKLAEQGITVPWTDIRDAIERDYFNKTDNEQLEELKRGHRLDNIKKSLTTADATFDADTGNLLDDLALEFTSDPTIIFGGAAKVAAKRGAKDIATNALSKGLKASLGEGDAAIKYAKKVMADPNTRKFLKRMAKTDDGANIIFKNRKALQADTEVLLDSLKEAQPELFTTGMQEKVFKDTVLSELVDSTYNSNARVIASTARGIKDADRKALQFAYRVSTASDALDTAMLKLAFPEPFLVRDTYRLSKKAYMASPFGALAKKRALKRAEVVTSVVKGVSKDGILQATKDLEEATDVSRLSRKDVAGGARYIRSQIDEASILVRDTIDDVRAGYVSIDSARRQIDNYVEFLTNGELKTVDELEVWAAGLDDVYSREYIDALETLRATKTEFDDFVDMSNSKIKESFIDELSKAAQDDDSVIREVFNKYVHDVDFLYLRDEIKSVLPNRDDFINACIRDSKTALASGLLADRASVIKSIYNVVDDASDLTKRTIDNGFVKNAINSTNVLKRMINSGSKDSTHWYLEDLMDMVDTFDDSEHTYIRVYKTLDRAISNAEQFYLKASRKESFRKEIEAIISDLLDVQDAVRATDVVALDDVETISTLHLDIMQATHNMLNESSFKKFFKETYHQVFKKPIEEVEYIDYVGLDPVEVSIIKDLRRIQKSRTSIQLFNNFDNKLRLLPGMSEAKIYAIESALLGGFDSRKNILNEILHDPDGVWDYINEVLYNNFGESKLNMEYLSGKMQSLLSSKPDELFKGKYADELLDPENRELREWFSNIVKGNLYDPQNYADQQYLMILLTQPDLAKKYNSLAQSGEDLHILHVSSTGLNSNVDSITGIGYRQWVPVDDVDNLSLSDIKRIFDENPLPEDIKLKVKMTDSDIDNISHATLKAIFNSDETYDVLRTRFSKLFSKGVDDVEVTEKDILENLFKMLHDSQAAKNVGKTVINPYRFIIHDLESVSGSRGFNMRMLNERSAQYAVAGVENASYTAQYSKGLSVKSSNMALNSLQAVRETMQDASLTSEEFYNLERLLKDYNAGLKEARLRPHSVNDFEGLYNTLEHLQYSLNNFEVTDGTNKYIKDLKYGLSNNPVDMAGMKSAIKTTNYLNHEAQSYFVRSGVNKAARLSSLNFSDAEYFAHLNNANVNALQNISDMFGFDLRFDLDLDDAFGFHWRQHGNKQLGTTLIALNVGTVDDVTSTFMHELRHHWSTVDSYGRSFKDELRQKLLSMYSEVDLNEAKDLTGVVKAKNDPLLYYVNYIGRRYTDERYIGLSDDFMEEFVAPLFQYYFTDPEILKIVKHRITSLGLDTTSDGVSVLDFIDNISTLVNNRTNLNEWEGLLDKQSRPRGVVADAIDSLVLRSDLQDEFIFSVINCINHTDNIRNKLSEIAASNVVRDLNKYNIAGNVVNIERQYNLDKVKQVFNLKFDDYDWFELSLPTVEKMVDFAEDVINIRATDITSYAEDILSPFKEEFDKYVSDVQDIIRSYKDSSVGSSNYEYLLYLGSGNTAIDSYLNARKINDLLNITLTPIFDNVGMQSVLNEEMLVKIYKDAAYTPNMLDVLFGVVDTKIYKSGNIKDSYYKRFHYLKGSLENELELARNYKNAQYDIFSHIEQREHASLRLRFNGIKTGEDNMIGRAYTSTLNAVDNLSEKLIDNSRYYIYKNANSLKPEKTITARNVTRILSEQHHAVLQQYRLNRLKNPNGTFNSDQIIKELLYNNFNHISFQCSKYTDKDIDALYNFIKHIDDEGIDFVKCERDLKTDKLYIWLEGDKGVMSDTATNVEKRYVALSSGKRSKVYEAPEYSSLHDAVNIVDSNSTLSYYYKLNDELQNDIDSMLDAWSNIDLLTGGLSRGTSGRVLSRAEIEHYLNTLPEFMRNMTSPKNLLDDSTSKLIFDPGFVIEGETDYFLDMLDSTRYMRQVINQGTATMAYMFGNRAPTRFNDLLLGATDDDIMHFFSKNSDYSVYTLVPDDTYIHGVRMKELRLDTSRAIDFARSTDNAVILPYDIALNVMESINTAKVPNSVKGTLNKALIVMKAFQLCNVGSWVRNWYDATKKAAFDMGEDPSNLWHFLSYQGKAMKDMIAYRNIMKSYEGYIDELSWDIVKSSFETDMTYQDFEVLSNLFHSDNLTLENKVFKRNSDRLISGEDSGVRGLSSVDFEKAYKKAYGYKVSDELLAIHRHDIIPDDAQQAVYDDVVRKIDNHLKNTRLRFTPDKAINTLFHPFSVSENIVRYAQTLYLRDFGMADSQISKRIHLTQFGSKRYTATGYLEYAIPYSNYMYDNVMYWMRMIEENPRYFKYFENTYRTVASDHIEDMLDSGQDFDFNRDHALKTGGIPLGGTGLYFKLNPSFFDFVDNLYGGLPNFLDKLNPLLNIATRYTMSEMGLGSKYFFSDIDLNLSANDCIGEVSNIIPVVNQIYYTNRQYKRAKEIFNTDSDIPVRLLFTAFAPLIGVCHKYENTSASSFEDWQYELKKQGLWYDANLGRIVDISEKNQMGANNPNNTFDDIEAYSLVHFGKIWDGNQGKFVHYWDYQPGGFNEKFDFARDPEAWDRLCALYDSVGKEFDYNVGHFVYKSEVSKGGLNDPNITWEDKCGLMKDLYNKQWDTNQQRFVTPEYYMEGGLNDPNLTSSQKQALRLALFGQKWNNETQRYEVVAEPKVVFLNQYSKVDVNRDIYNRLGIPQLANLTSDVHINDEGLLVTKDGKYLLTHNAQYNEKVFNKFAIASFGRRYNGRYNRWRRYSYNKTRKPKKVSRVYNPYQTGFGWNENEGYYRLEYKDNTQYAYRISVQVRNAQPARVRLRLSAPHVHYPYGGGYSKFSFHMR